MHLKSLTLRGFKSFASATTLNFEPGITCVVGPNGSGKSNVVDALSWVMGEQGAKSLRGGKMEDVIFAGTSKRPALGRAEVVLTIDNSDGALPIDYTEVMISRTMFRHGGSEYSINGSPVRLLDVQDLLSDSGIGREMHVIVGQGQLDSILQATPEGRRGFIEEAAGILKHRKRKEKALRKLEATEANMNRCGDLLAELRRQLKPLARQADVARKAAVIQAELRDARARLLADDVVTAQLTMAAELADERALKEKKALAAAAVEQAHADLALVEDQLQGLAPRVQATQDLFYGFKSLVERLDSTQSIATERIRQTENYEVPKPSRDPDTLDAEAGAAEKSEAGLRAEVATKAQLLADLTRRREVAERAHTEAEAEFASKATAQAKRREALVRLNGAAQAATSRAEASLAQITRLESDRDEALARSAAAKAEFTSVESSLAELDPGEHGLDKVYEAAQKSAKECEAALEKLLDDQRVCGERRAGLVARIEGLQVAIQQRDGGAHLSAHAESLGISGFLPELLKVEPGYEAAIAAALGGAGDSLLVPGLAEARASFDLLRRDDGGRAWVVVESGPQADPKPPKLPVGRWALEVVHPDASVERAVAWALADVVVIDSPDDAEAALAVVPRGCAVTREGDVFTSWRAQGGSSSAPSGLEIQSRIDAARDDLVAAEAQFEELTYAVGRARNAHHQSVEQVEIALAQLQASDAKLASVSEKLGALGAAAGLAQDEAERMNARIASLRTTREADLAAADEARTKAEALASVPEEESPSQDRRDEAAAEAKLLRAQEMEARLGLRTIEERARGLAGRAESLRKNAAREREVLARAEAKRAELDRQVTRAQAVVAAVTWLRDRAKSGLATAQEQRTALDAERGQTQAEVTRLRAVVRAAESSLQELTASVHQDELARAQQRMRLDALSTKALDELGIDLDSLIDDYGPDKLIPVLTRPDGTALEDDDERPEPVPFVREEQERRRARNEKSLNILGRVNPLALEEYDAMQERHAFLAQQLDDVRKTRADLFDIIADVDRRVEQVFANAYADVEAAFEKVFARLFPGGEGRLILTEPGEWLTTGVDVEARPAGKKIKRLSLLSGGERSLVAVAFLVSLFIARPSPFYILDEVEAALDDVNLGRLLEIYEELRESSQLLVITHQKRTMEIADALYGVTMQGDGVSTVISQRLRDE